jgi:hypothetical protein
MSIHDVKRPSLQRCGIIPPRVDRIAGCIISLLHHEESTQTIQWRESPKEAGSGVGFPLKKKKKNYATITRNYMN